MSKMRKNILTVGLFVAAALFPLNLAMATQVGHASWYALHSQTASGEKMDPSAMTAAHPSLPFGTKVLVENLSNGRSVTVRINDRGPFVGGRIIDVSKAAASSLGMIELGTANVRVTPTGEAVASSRQPTVVASNQEKTESPRGLMRTAAMRKAPVAKASALAKIASKESARKRSVALASARTRTSRELRHAVAMAQKAPPSHRYARNAVVVASAAPAYGASAGGSYGILGSNTPGFMQDGASGSRRFGRTAIN